MGGVETKRSGGENGDGRGDRDAALTDTAAPPARDPTRREDDTTAPPAPDSTRREDDTALADTAASPSPGRDALGAPAAAGASPAAVRQSPAGELAGERFAHFRIEERLGAGGMGEVYLATDTSLDRPVALKVLSREVAGDPDLRERFYREARAQARIQHANVCHIYYIGEEAGRLFFAMEYVEGESLQERLDREGAVPVAESLELCAMAARGLAEAARHGFTHRDVKPSNLMVDRHGVVKILDFGLVKRAGAPAQDVALTGDRLEVLGTPLYLSPEQAKGERVDLRSDIYSLGATLHHLLAGEPPFRADSAMEVVAKHISERRPPATAATSGPCGTRSSPEVDELCDRMMAKDPAQRFSSYDELVEAMDEAAPARHIPAGVWARAFALAIDFLAVAAASSLLALPLAFGVGDRAANVAMTALIIALFSAQGIAGPARWGKTLGKYLLSLRVVAEPRGGAPRVGRSAARFGLQWGPACTVSAIEALATALGGAEHGLGAPLPLAFAAALAYAAIAGALAAARADKRAIWDRAAKTRVTYDYPRGPR